jgi:hypothetical protein
MSQQPNNSGMSESFPDKYGKTLKVISIVCGGVLFLLAILNFFAFAIEDPIDIILPLYYV